MIAFRDPLLNESDTEVGEDEHGSAFERVSAFQFGFTDGASSCAAIDMQEIEQRRGDLPVLLPDDQTGELPVTEESVRSIVDAMGILFAPDNPPAADASSRRSARTPGVRPAAVVSARRPTRSSSTCPHCRRSGTPSDDGGRRRLATGDNTAYSVLVSRYMQAIQHEHGGVALDNAEAALRTACLTGVATVKMTSEVTTPGRQHHRADRGRRRRGGVGHPRQRPGRQRRQRRIGAVGLLPHRRVPRRRARRRGPLLQALRLTASSDGSWSRRSRPG